MAEPSSLKELACEAVSALCFNTLVGFPSALPVYFEDEALKTMLIPVREICLEKLNDLVTKEVPASDGPPMDYCTILEGILDDHFEILEIITPLPCRSSFSKLMAVLSQRCPKLKWLEITFSNNHAGIQLASLTPAPTPAQLTFRLDHLKSLSLFRSSWLQQDEPLPLISLESLLGIIGQICPKLEELDFSDFSNIDEKKSILALLMGQDLARALFPPGGMWARDSILYKLRIPTKYLSPVCFTLERLLPFRVDHYGAEYAFALRHLPKLRHWNFKNTGDDEDIPIYLIKALHRAEEEKDSHQLQQEAFEAACRSSAAVLNLNVEASSSTLLSGPLSSIKNIDYVSVRDWNALTAVGTMCPHLNVIDFQDVDNPDDYVSTYSTSQYGKMFKDCWSMAHKPYIHLIGLNSDFVSILLSAFGSSMTNLTLINCRRVNLTNLWQCTQLERLSVTNSSINSETSDPAIRTSSTFLPSLLRVHCCAVSFPNWSFWLESKSSLIKQRE